MNAYLAVFDDTRLTRNQFVEAINRVSAVEDWLSFMPSAACLISPLSATELTGAIQAQNANIRLMITQIDLANMNGRLEREVWEFIHKPRTAPRERQLARQLA